MRAFARREWLGTPAVPLDERIFGRLPHFVPEGALDGCDAIVHCAVSTDGDLGVAWAVNVDGTLLLARAARDTGARCFVFLSSQSARGDTRSVYGRTKWEAEQRLLADPSLHAVVIRPGLVCGRGGLFRRLATTVERAPVIPLVAGDAPVQPIFVDDLVAGILRCIADPARYEQRVFEVGLADPQTLRELVGMIADAAGRRPAIIRVPVAPIAAAVGISERLGIRLPVSSTNIVGARGVRPMATTASNAALGIPPRTAREIVDLASKTASSVGTDAIGPTRTLLIGAGRIGIVHAVTLSRLPGVFLAGMLDRRSKALKLLRSVGIRAPGTTAEADIREVTYDAAVIATPPSTHVAIARSRIERGERILIEKPTARGPSDLAEFEPLATRSGDRALVGYFMPRMPHIRSWLAKLRAGDLGTVRSFTGITLASLIDARSGPRWETTKAVSGGGVLINSASHVLSLIHEAFGVPSSVRAEILSRFSREVEDSAIVRLDYGSFAGTHYSSWCIPGFPRQENRLVIETDRGILTITATAAVFDDGTRPLVIEHQLDHDVGFNLAPDYAGAGIAVELRELAGFRFAGPLAEPMTLNRGLGIERMLFSMYAGAATVDRFTTATFSAPSIRRADRRPSRACADLRDASPEVLVSAVARAPHGVLIRAAQLAHTGGVSADDIVITVPDFLGYTRLITDHQNAELARRLGVRGMAAAGRAAAVSVSRDRLVGFWPVADALLSAELTRIPRAFSGTLLLHPYLADLAIALDRLEMLQRMLDRIRSKRGARCGFHSNLGREAANAVLLLRRTPDVLSLLTSPNGSHIGAIRAWFDADVRTSGIGLIAEVGPAPLAVHTAAFAEPDRWATAPVRVVASGIALVAAEPHVRDEWVDDWSMVFPGVPPLPLELVA